MHGTREETECGTQIGLHGADRDGIAIDNVVAAARLRGERQEVIPAVSIAFRLCV